MTDPIYPDFLGTANRGYDRGRSMLSDKLAGQAFNAPADQRQSLLGQLAGVNPQAAMGMQSRFQQQDQMQQAQAKAQQVDHAKKLNGAANFMLQAVATKDPARIQGAWQSVRPYLAELSGKTPPDQFDPAMLPKMYEIVGQTGGMPQQKGTVVAPGGTMVDSATGQAMFSNPAAPANGQLVDIPDGQGGTVKMLFDPRTRQLSQPNFGGQSQGAPQGDPQQFQTQITPASPANTGAADQANAMLAQGMQPQEVMQRLIQAHPDQQFQLAVDPATGQFKDVSDGSAQFPQGQPRAPTHGLGYAPPKGNGSDSFRSATPAELKMYGLPENAVAQVNTKTGKLDVISKPAALSPDKLADVAVKRQKVEQAKQESVATFNDSINKIDSLLNDKSFGSLGTFTGDIAAKIPHTDTANARSMLDTISAQSVINVLSSLKSLSANGASGFGALSEKEGEILRNAAANLSTSQSNAAIKQNLLDLKQKLARSRDRIASQQIKLPEDSVGQQASVSTPQATARPRAVNSMGHAVVWNGSAWVPE